MVSAIAYLPFGPAGAYTFGNSDILRRTFDQDYRPTGVVSTPLTLQYTLDAIGNPIALTDAPAQSAPVETYAYDPLNRLQQVEHAGAPWQSYTWNPTGDRLSKTTAGIGTDIYQYQNGTHHLTALIGAEPSDRALDANGNTTALQAHGWAYKLHYNDTNRLARVRQSGTPIMHYVLNGQGQRVSKITMITPAHGCKKHKHGKKRKKHCKPKPGAVTDFIHDRAGHLLAEYGDDASRAYIWADNTLVAVLDNPLQGGGDVINYVYTDQLGTPRAVTTPSGATLWTWPQTLNPFGERAPSDDGYTFNLRYPGQYFDAETGLNYNYFRDYEAGTGRYLQSDPIGLQGGPNTYSFVLGNPISLVDRFGLDIRVQWHTVLGPYDHTLIRVTPVNQDRYAGDPRFSGNPGSRFITFGAGQNDGNLVSNFNRPTDVGPQEGGVALNTCDEDALIDGLFAADSRYRDNADYDIFPAPGGIMPMDNGWNSNSYTAGMLNSVGIDPRSIGLPTNVAFPGWDKPLPIPSP